MEKKVKSLLCQLWPFSLPSSISFLSMSLRGRRLLVIWAQEATRGGQARVEGAPFLSRAFLFLHPNYLQARVTQAIPSLGVFKFQKRSLQK